MAKKSNTSTTSSSSTTKNSSNIISQVFNKVKEDYLSTITKKVAFLDALALYSILTALTQIVYMILVGNFPFNSFLSSLIFQISIFALSGIFSLLFSLLLNILNLYFFLIFFSFITSSINFSRI